MQRKVLYVKNQEYRPLYFARAISLFTRYVSYRRYSDIAFGISDVRRKRWRL